MAGFVAMPITALSEHGVELGDESLASAHNRDETFYIVWHIPGVMAGSSLGDVWLAMHEIGVVFPGSIGMSAVGITQ